MPNLEVLLGENDLTNLAFSIIEQFSTQRSMDDLLPSLFQLIGESIQLWTGADEVAHVFINPRLPQCHRVKCASSDDGNKVKSRYQEFGVGLQIPHFTDFSDHKHWQPKEVELARDDDAKLVKVAISDQNFQVNESVWLAQLDIANRAPLGHFVLIWHQTPELSESAALHVQEVLWNLARVVSSVLCSHYPIHRNTYLPSFQPEDDVAAAILFADLRNSTPFFEISRLGGEEQMRRVEALLRVWFRYAADLIAARCLGNLHRFTGDGLVSTFGEYGLSSKRVSNDEGGCILALHAGRHLIRSFSSIYDLWMQDPQVASFFRDHNEDVELRLGVGINFGRVCFTYIGRPATAREVFCPGCGHVGHLEYCAFGDHMNTAARLADCASRHSADVDIKVRGNRFRDERQIAPIVASNTAARRFAKALNGAGVDLADRQGTLRMKGKEHGLMFYEFSSDDVDDIRLAELVSDASDSHYLECIRNPPPLAEYHELLKTELNAS